jgi:3-oxoacyl-[acyl-carrier-protein] synthase III
MPQIPAGAVGAVITGWGTALPPKTVTNEELAAYLDTSD